MGSLASAGRHIPVAVGGWTAGWRLRTDMPAAPREPPLGREGPHAGGRRGDPWGCARWLRRGGTFRVRSASWQQPPPADGSACGPDRAPTKVAMVLAPAAIVETRGVALSGFGGAVHCGCGLRLGGRLPPAGRPWELEDPSLCPDGAGAAAWPPGAGPAILPDRPSSLPSGRAGRRCASGRSRSGSGSPSGPLAEGGAAPGASVTAQVRISPSPARGDGRYPTARNGHPVRRRRRRNPPSRGVGPACPR